MDGERDQHRQLSERDRPGRYRPLEGVRRHPLPESYIPWWRPSSRYSGHMPPGLLWTCKYIRGPPSRIFNQRASSTSYLPYTAACILVIYYTYVISIFFLSHFVCNICSFIVVLMYRDKFMPKFWRFNTFNCTVLLCSYFHSLITFLFTVVFVYRCLRFPP